MVLILLLYFICASTFTITKWGLLFSAPVFYVAVRMILAGLILYLYSAFTSKTKLKLEDIGLFLQIILFHIYFTYVFDASALKDITSIESAFLYNFSPFIAALFSYFMFNEKMTLKKWIGLLLGFFSLLPDILPCFLYQQQFTSVKAKLLTLLSVVTSAYGWIILRKLVKDKGYTSIYVNSIGMLFGGILALGTSLYIENWNPWPVDNWTCFLYSLASIILVSNIIFYNLYGYLLKFYTATILAFAGFMCPLFTALLGWLFLSECISGRLLISMIGVSVGLYIFYQEELRQGYIKE